MVQKNWSPNISRQRWEECEKRFQKCKPLVKKRKNESKGSAKRIQAILKKNGVLDKNTISCNLDGLIYVEDQMHQVAQGKIKTDQKQFEELVGYFFAQCMIETANGQWGIYDVRTESWGPTVNLLVGKAKIGAIYLAQQVYAKGVGSRPKRKLSRILKKTIESQ